MKVSETVGMSSRRWYEQAALGADDDRRSDRRFSIIGVMTLRRDQGRSSRGSASSAATSSSSRRTVINAGRNEDSINRRNITLAQKQKSSG
jgi:hypothetical protein